jgi:hypothetical protein
MLDIFVKADVAQLRVFDVPQTKLCYATQYPPCWKQIRNDAIHFVMGLNNSSKRADKSWDKATCALEAQVTQYEYAEDFATSGFTKMSKMSVDSTPLYMKYVCKCTQKGTKSYLIMG